MSDDERLERGDARLLAALLAGATYAQAADQSNLSVATVRRRVQDTAFRRELLEARQQLLDECVTTLAATASQAAKTLRQLLVSPHDGVRLAAARSILDQVVRLRDASDLEARVLALEERAQTAPTPLRAVGEG